MALFKNIFKPVNFPFPALVRPLAPLYQAVNDAKRSLYSPPPNRIEGLDNTNLWPAPLQPISPITPPGGGPLRYPFEFGSNLFYTPRKDAFYSAADLRMLSTYPLARICIENNKDMITRMPHRIQLKPLPGETSKARAERSKGDPNLSKLNKLFDRPNPEQNWSEFLRPVLEDMLVIDAPAIMVLRNLATRKIQELRWTDGASITILIEEHGFTPPPPNPAYQQQWEGYPRINLTTEQLVYKPRNIVPRNTYASFLYGMSPSEQVAREIEIGQARLSFVYDFYREGSVPGGMHFVPPGVSPDKIKEAQQYLDATYSGNLPGRRKLILMQGWQTDGHAEQLAFPKEPALADLFDEVHTRKICFAYGTSPQRLMRQMNRASASVAQAAAEEEGTLPWMDWLKGVIDHIIQDLMGFEEYEFAFDPFHELDKLKQSQADEKDISNGLYTRNEIRERRGDDPRPEPDADVLTVKTNLGAIPLGSVAQSGPNGSSVSKPKSKPAAQDRGTASKTNGHTSWSTCSTHKDSYPRSFCADCNLAEEFTNQVIQKQLENAI